MFKRLTAMALFVVTVFTCSAGAAIRSDDYYRQQLGDEAYEQMVEDYQKDLEENTYRYLHSPRPKQVSKLYTRRKIRILGANFGPNALPQ